MLKLITKTFHGRSFDFEQTFKRVLVGRVVILTQRAQKSELPGELECLLLQKEIGWRVDLILIRHADCAHTHARMARHETISRLDTPQNSDI